MKDTYVRRRRGEAKCDSPRLARLMPQTVRVMLYQEDVLRVVRDVAGLTLERADQLRRALSGLADEERARTLAREFLAGARGRGVADAEAERIWAMVSNFVSYSYSKAHAATYARISWQALWLKARHPAAFFAAVLANGGGFYDGRAYVEEARRRGAAILLPDINRSQETEALEGGGDAIRIGLGRVRDLTRKTLDLVFARRPFVSLTDFLQRMPEAQQRETEHLVLTGCFDAFDGTRPEKLWRVLLWARARGSSRAPAPPFDLLGGRTLLPPERTLPALREYGPGKALLLEQELLGLTPSAHPMALFERRAQDAGAVRTVDVPALAGRRVAVAGWMTTARRIRTKKGELMKFITLEDRWGVIEINFFPQVYRRCGHLLVGQGPYLVHGRVDDHLGATTLTAESLAWLEADA